MTIDELFNSKMKLKQGDVIRFHDWGVGGNLVGVIADLPPFEDDPDTVSYTHLDVYKRQI